MSTGRTRIVLAAVPAAVFAFVLVAAGFTSVSTADIVYSTDFPTDPNWVTNEPSRYYWNSGSEDYAVRQIVLETGGYYALHDVGCNLGAFRFSYDISVSSADWAGSVDFGMYEEDGESVDHGSFVNLRFTHADEGYRVRMETSNIANELRGITSLNAFSLDIPYHVEVEYDSVSGTLSADVTERGTGLNLTSVALSDVGPFSPSMTWIGSSNYRSGTNLPQYIGAEGIGTIDNVTFVGIPEPVTLGGMVLGLAALVRYVRRRK